MAKPEWKDTYIIQFGPNVHEVDRPTGHHRIVDRQTLAPPLKREKRDGKIIYRKDETRCW